jgi:hypothetical protein
VVGLDVEAAASESSCLVSSFATWAEDSSGYKVRGLRAGVW